MQPEDRTIHFSTELIHAPIEHRRQDLQKLYFDLSQLAGAGYDSIDFSVAAQPKFHSRRGNKSASVAVFLPDRLVLVEEWADVSLSDFLERVDRVARRSMQVLKVPLFVAQAATLRSTFVLSHFDDARTFLMDHTCNQQGRIRPHFQRPIGVAGLRFALPETPEHPGLFNVTIESFKYDPREVFVEVKGVYQQLQVDEEGLSLVADHIRQVRSFITDNVYPFLNQYDEPAAR